MIGTNEITQILDIDDEERLPTWHSYYGWKMLKDRRIWVDKYIDDDILDYERMILQWNIEDKGIEKEKRKPIWLYMFNFGGDADIMWSFVGIIQTSETPIYTVNMGQCCSAASIIFITGHKRFMFPGASVMFHEGSGDFSGDATKLFDNVDAYKEMIKRMNEYVVEKTKITKQMISRKKNNDWILNTTQCKELGVCDTVISSINEVF